MIDTTNDYKSDCGSLDDHDEPPTRCYECGRIIPPSAFKMKAVPANIMDIEWCEDCFDKWHHENESDQ